jgi:hypothetical protein
MAKQKPTRDSLHHEAFSELRVARSFFENYLPAELAQAVDWSTLSNETPVYKKCFDTDAFCDLLFAVRFRDKTTQNRNTLFLNLLFEHQSRPDPLMPNPRALLRVARSRAKTRASTKYGLRA